MALTELEELLRESIGLSAASIGSAAIERAAQERRSVCRLADAHAYLGLVRASAIELQALIEAVVIPESWFFRDRRAFTALARIAREEWLPAHPLGVLSLLSLPCSTGEEPYSMAMALIDAGVPARRFLIDAVDISRRSVAQGVRAIYGRNSFRGRDLEFRDRHFDLTLDGFVVHETVRRRVRFHPGNLFATDLLAGVAPYDAIFCRNVLIYCDGPMQHRAFDVLNRLLHVNGTLFVAPAESALPGSHGLISTREALAFAFRKAALAPLVREFKADRSAPVPPPRTAGSPMLIAPWGHGVRGAVPAAGVEPPTGLSPLHQASLAADLGEATRLADRGHFAEAARCCEQHLRHSAPSATAFYLLGLVRDATGNHTEAAAYYRKALYLEPDHYDTQIHLALLLETRGDHAAAQVLRDRARRLEQQRQTSHG